MLSRTTEDLPSFAANSGPRYRTAQKKAQRDGFAARWANAMDGCLDYVPGSKLVNLVSMAPTIRRVFSTPPQRIVKEISGSA